MKRIMEKKSQHNNILLAVFAFAAVVVVVGVIGFVAFGRTPDVIQGEVEVSEYRVSSKVPGRILELRVQEGDYESRRYARHTRRARHRG